MKVRADQLDSHLKDRLLPLYLISGEEPLLVAEAMDAIRHRAHEAGHTERQVFFAERGFDWNRVLAGGASLSLFSERRIIEIRLPTGKPGEAGAKCLTELAAAPPEDTVVMVAAPKLERAQLNSKWVKSLEKAGAHVQVWPVDASDLPAWLTRRMRALGMQPSKDAVRLLADRVEGNLLAAAQELEKLRLLRGQGRVDADQIEAAVADSARFNIFKLGDAAVAGHAERSLRILGALRLEGIEPVLILWALTREIRSAALIAGDIEDGVPLAQSMKRRGVWSSRAGMVRACVGRHDAWSLYGLLRRADRADRIVKGRASGRPWEEIIALVTALANTPTPRKAA